MSCEVPSGPVSMRPGCGCDGAVRVEGALDRTNRPDKVKAGGKGSKGYWQDRGKSWPRGGGESDKRRKAAREEPRNRRTAFNKGNVLSEYASRRSSWWEDEWEYG